MTKELSPLRQKDIRQGEQQERERIIALLEAELGDEAEVCEGCDITRHHIALIKGENE